MAIIVLQGVSVHETATHS